MEVTAAEAKFSKHESSMRICRLRNRAAGVHLAAKHDLETKRIAFIVWRTAQMAFGGSAERDPEESWMHQPSSRTVAIIVARMIGLQNSALLQAIITAWHAGVVDRMWANDVVKLQHQLAHAAARSKARITMREAILLRRIYSAWQSHTNRVVRCDAFEEIRRLKTMSQHSVSVFTARLISCQGEALLRVSIRIWYILAILGRVGRGRVALAAAIASESGRLAVHPEGQQRSITSQSGRLASHSESQQRAIAGESGTLPVYPESQLRPFQGRTVVAQPSLSVTLGGYEATSSSPSLTPPPGPPRSPQHGSSVVTSFTTETRENSRVHQEWSMTYHVERPEEMMWGTGAAAAASSRYLARSPGMLQRRAVTAGAGSRDASLHLQVMRALKWRQAAEVRRLCELTLETWWRHCLRVRCERRVRLITDERDALEWELSNLRNGRERCKRSALAIIERSVSATLMANTLEGRTMASLPDSRSVPL
mmetsp:Transcript_154478/g.267587  ORF Transcript_154478/g.267587 Transcript_154478/m.267587 type:complete len:481 (-) Transcript_154478:45-1487(-)